MEEFKRSAIRATGIVYGEVVDDIGSPVRRSGIKFGTLRVLHVYRGALKPSQKIKMAAASWPLSKPGCWMPPPVYGRGHYGVAIINIPTDGSPTYLAGFLPSDMLKTFFDEGLIQPASAKGTQTKSSQ